MTSHVQRRSKRVLSPSAPTVPACGRGLASSRGRSRPASRFCWFRPRSEWGQAPRTASPGNTGVLRRRVTQMFRRKSGPARSAVCEEDFPLCWFRRPSVSARNAAGVRAASSYLPRPCLLTAPVSADAFQPVAGIRCHDNKSQPVGNKHADVFFRGAGIDTGSASLAAAAAATGAVRLWSCRLSLRLLIPFKFLLMTPSDGN